MKYCVIILILLICCGKQQRVTSIEIWAISPTSSTPYRVSAQDFFNMSSGAEFKQRVITSPDSLSLILSQLEELESDSEMKRVDTKAVLLLNYLSNTDTVSANWNCILFKGRIYKTPDELRSIFWPSFKIPTFEK